MFLSFARQAFQNRAMYRTDFWMEIITEFIAIYGVFWVWHTLYAQDASLFTISLDQMITYAVLGMALETIFLPWIGPQMYISDRVKNGLLEMDLMKPIDFQLHMLARNAGEVVFRFFLMFLPILIVCGLFFDFKLPSSFLDGATFLLSVFFAFLILFALNFLLGMLSIVTISIQSISWAYQGLLRFLSGQIVPLWMFPVGLATVVGALPFSSIYYVPSSIYIGKIHGMGALHALGIQVVWIVVLFGLGRFAWSRIYSKMMVQGG
jgi:ABC-2 type transport system permease protein